MNQEVRDIRGAAGLPSESREKGWLGFYPENVQHQQCRKGLNQQGKAHPNIHP